MRTYTSVNPIDLEDLLEQTGWSFADGMEESIEDGHGNLAYVTETEDGHVQLLVEEGSDVSDILERVSFHLEDAEDD